MGHSHAGLLLLGDRGKADQALGLSLPGAGDELDLRIFARPDRDQGLARPRPAGFRPELRIHGRSRRHPASSARAGGPLVSVLLALPAQDFLQDLNRRYYSTEGK